MKCSIRIDRLLCATLCGIVMYQPCHASGLGYDGPPAQEICALCHSLDGVSRMSKFPRLAGQKAHYIEKQLTDFLAGERSNDGGQMSAIVTEIEPEQIKDVAAYFSSLTPPPPVLPEDGQQTAPGIVGLVMNGDPIRGILPCASCHLPEMIKTPSPESASAPYLTSQHADYIAKQLRDFRSGERANDGTNTMSVIAKALDDREIDGLASYLASLPRTGKHDR
jgi:cytochrome c553